MELLSVGKRGRKGGQVSKKPGHTEGVGRQSHETAISPALLLKSVSWCAWVRSPDELGRGCNTSYAQRIMFSFSCWIHSTNILLFADGPHYLSRFATCCRPVKHHKFSWEVPGTSWFLSTSIEQTAERCSEPLATWAVIDFKTCSCNQREAQNPCKPNQTKESISQQHIGYGKPETLAGRGKADENQFF